MASINKVILIGRLGKDPEIRITSSGGKFATLTIATSESWKDKTTGERKERTEWHNVVLNTTALAEIAERYMHKGSQAYIEGQLRTREWTDQNGNKRYTTEIVAGAFSGQVIILDAKEKSQQDVQTTYTPQEEVADNDLDDDIPF